MNLHLLGTGAAISDPHRTTTMLAYSDESGSLLLVDCGGDAAQRLLAAGHRLSDLDALILTHEHADHVGGFPLLMEKIWLDGRDRPLPICGIEPALTQARRALETFDTSGWNDMPELRWRECELAENALFYDDGSWRVTASPARHSKPNVHLRVEHEPTDRVAAYSCDTEPTEAFARLAEGAHVMVHEANGNVEGHSSPEQAARVATDAGAERLLLVHLPPGLTEDDLREARDTFPETALGAEGASYRV
jgi:ribonuclease Z